MPSNLQALLVRLPVPLYRDLKRHSTETGIPMARLVTDAVRELLRVRTRGEA